MWKDVTRVEFFEQLNNYKGRYEIVSDDVYETVVRFVYLEEDESEDILSEIFKHQERLDFTCRFKWTENAVAIWDNRSTLHQGLTDFFPGRGLGHERIMDRIAVEGDQPN